MEYACQVMLVFIRQHIFIRHGENSSQEENN